MHAAVDAGEPFLSMLASKFDPAALAASPMVLTGTPAEMAEKLSGLAQGTGSGR